MSDYLLTLSDIYFIINMVGRMLYRYSELLKNEKFNTDRKIKVALSEKRLFKLDCGFYSFDSRCSELEFIAKKYDNAVFNFDSAFYYYGLTDNIPDKYYLSTKKKARKIKDDRVIQTFMDDRYFNIGITYIYYNNVRIKIYDKERMLIELVRNKNNMSYDMYKEIINNYRSIVDELNFLKLQDYLSNFKNKDKYLKIIQEEVL